MRKLKIQGGSEERGIEKVGEKGIKKVGVVLGADGLEEYQFDGFEAPVSPSREKKGKKGGTRETQKVLREAAKRRGRNVSTVTPQELGERRVAESNLEKGKRDTVGCKYHLVPPLSKRQLEGTTSVLGTIYSVREGKIEWQTVSCGGKKKKYLQIKREGKKGGFSCTNESHRGGV